jgi:DNA polymerase V
MLRDITPQRDEVLEPLENANEVSGFQSPAADYQTNRLNILARIVSDPINTYFFECTTDDMDLFHINKSSLLVVDKSIKPAGGLLVVAWVDGEWVVRQLIVHGRKQYLTTGKEHHPFLEIDEANGVLIFGVVTWSCNPQAEHCKYMIPDKNKL